MSLTLSKKTRKGWGTDDTGGKKMPCQRSSRGSTYLNSLNIVLNVKTVLSIVSDECIARHERKFN